VEPQIDHLEWYFSPPTPLTPLTMRVIKWEGEEELKMYLHAHGVLLEEKGEYFLLTFPAGTLASRRLPVARDHVRRLTLPDTTIVTTIYMAGRQRYTIGVDREAFEAFKKQSEKSS
jgi:hypothetical protein